MSPEFPKKTILYVEDESDYFAFVARPLFSHIGVGVKWRKNKEEAIDEARKTGFDVYVTDGGYPLIPGSKDIDSSACIKFYKDLKSIRPDAKVFLLTNFGSKEPVVEEAISLGMDYINKGEFALLEPEELYKTLFPE